MTNTICRQPIIPIKIGTCAASANAKAKQAISYILYNALELYAMRITSAVRRAETKMNVHESLFGLFPHTRMLRQSFMGLVAWQFVRWQRMTGCYRECFRRLDRVANKLTMTKASVEGSGMMGTEWECAGSWDSVSVTFSLPNF